MAISCINIFQILVCRNSIAEQYNSANFFHSFIIGGHFPRLKFGKRRLAQGGGQCRQDTNSLFMLINDICLLGDINSIACVHF